MIWIEAMRLRTLPVSIAGVLAGVAYSVAAGRFSLAPALLCLMFALLAQIASNFANEYYDFRDGLDRAGREGPRRGVTEGDITPRAMLRATMVTLGAACCVGLSLIYWGGWWLLPVGVVIVAGALAYSAGPYPLSRHALGEVAVIFFFGIIPVNLTYYIMCNEFSVETAFGSLAIGLMGANVLLVNNYRDEEDDRMVGKITLAVKFGKKAAATIYLINGIAAAALTWGFFSRAVAVPVAYALIHMLLWRYVTTHEGRALNRALGMTAMLMLAYSAVMVAAAIAFA